MTDGGWTTRLRSVALLLWTSLALLTAACTAQTDPTTTTSAAIAAEPVPSTSTTTTTKPEDTSVDICGRGVIWEPGATYISACFLTPLAFAPEAEGWRSSRASLEAVEGLWVAPGEQEPAIRYVVLAYLPDNTPDEVVTSILSIDGVDPTTTPFGDQTVSVEVETAPLRSSVAGECVSTAHALRLAGGSGYVLLDLMSVNSGYLYGLGACRIFRIWAIPIADITVTVVATTDDLDRFDELMPTMQQLVDTMQAATP